MAVMLSIMAYQDIGVAVSTERGLVVPIIKDADTKSLPELEKSILEYSEKAQRRQT